MPQRPVLRLRLLRTHPPFPLLRTQHGLTRWLPPLAGRRLTATALVHISSHLYMHYPLLFNDGGRSSSSGGCSPAALREMLLSGAHQLAIRRGSPETSKRPYERVFDLRRDDPDFIYSLYRYLQAIPLMHLSPYFHEAVTLCRSFDTINQTLRQRRAQRQERLLAWSALSTTTPLGTWEEGLSLLHLMQTLPPPFTPIDVLPFDALARLAQTCKAWYAAVVGCHLPQLLRRSLNQPTLALGTWRCRETLDGPREDVWSHCTLHSSSSPTNTTDTNTDTTPPAMPWTTEAVPAIRCPMLLRWMLTHEERGAAARTIIDDRSPSIAVAAMLEHWDRVDHTSCPKDSIKSCLRLLGGVASGVATFTKRVTGFPTQSEQHMICLYVSGGADSTAHEESADEEGVEVLCDVEWGVYAYSYY
jgi:hypothetical protein